MPGTVVIAIDHSDLSARALPFARGVARLWRSRLVLVHATSTRERHLDSRLQQLELRGEGIDAEAVVRPESPARAIVDVASERDAQLIVMASHQRHGIDRWLNGSVTEEVLSLTATPLLVVPAHAEFALDRAQRVMIPLDGSEVGEAALSFVGERATRRPLELRLVRFVSVAPVVVGVGPSAAGYAPSLEEVDAEVQSATDYLAEQARILQDPLVSTQYEVIQATEPVSGSILEVAQAQRVDMIAVGTHAKVGDARFVLGSVSEELPERSPIPVLLVRQLGSSTTTAPRNQAGPRR